jgi:malonyl-CoA/methylmalonyl-CoA synthetase
MNLFNVLTRQVSSRALEHCVLCEDYGLVTYAELYQQSGRYAQALVQLGVQPGDRVAAKTDKGVTSLFLYLAVLRVGGAYLPLNTGYTPAEIEYFLSDATPRLLICPQSEQEKLSPVVDLLSATSIETLEADGGGTLAERAQAADENHTVVDRDADQLAAILYTSGTTGRPKGAMITHGNLISNLEALTSTWRYQPTDRLIHALPMFHSHGLFVACNLTLANGASMFFLKKFNPLRVMELMAEATVLMGVPAFYVRLLANPGFTRETAAPMRLFVSGSAPMTEEVHKAFVERTGQQVLERYGMTEANMITSNLYDKRKIGSVGPALPDVEVRVSDPEQGGTPVSGQVGMVEIRGRNLFKGYWNQPEKTAEEFTDDGFFITGDLGILDQDGFLSIVGRSKDLVISGGYNVYPKEIEQQLDAVSGIAESAVVGVPHPDLGEGVFAVVVADGTTELDLETLRTALGEHLAAYKVPKRLVLADSLPRNTMGKVQKNLLRELYQNEFIC